MPAVDLLNMNKPNQTKPNILVASSYMLWFHLLWQPGIWCQTMFLYLLVPWCVSVCVYVYVCKIFNTNYLHFFLFVNYCSGHVVNSAFGHLQGASKFFDICSYSGVPRNFFQGGFNKFSWGQRGRGSGGRSPLVRGSGGSCNLVQEISFHIVKFS